MSRLPEILISGEIARLIPVIADSRKEQPVTSVFLATLSAVPSFAQSLFATIGQRMGRRSVIDTYTETVLRGDEKGRDRPDGLVIITSGSKTWLALIEAKIGHAGLNSEQVQRYLQLARDNGVDAVITISNQFVARPDHNPVNVPKTVTRRASLHHWSWAFVLTEAILQQQRGIVTDPEQAFVLIEFIRFLSHESVGVIGFDQMPAEWRSLNALVKSGGSIRRRAPEVEEIVGAWHQETRDLALRMSRHLASSCDLRLPRSHVRDQMQRMKDDCTTLAAKDTLAAEYIIPNAAAPLGVTVDLKAQTIRVGMEVEAPQDWQRAVPRVNWLLRQLRNVEVDGLFIRMIWPTRASDLVCNLGDLQGDVRAVLEGVNQLPRAFEVFLLRQDGRRFAGRKTFIEDLEHAVPDFYDQVGQHLEQWRPKPPKPVREVAAEEESDRPSTEQQTPPDPAVPVPVFNPTPPALQGNQHTDLLDIPGFLKR